MNILKTHNPKIYVISVGNITTGGTGKSPMVVELANYFADDKHFNTTIITRGYGKKSKNALTEIKINNKIIVNDPDESGDEALMIANLTNNVDIVTCPDRAKAIEWVKNKYDSNLIILDDAFQHLAIKRNLNIVLVDAISLFGNNQLLPLGPLREPLSSLNRADVLVLVNKNVSGEKLSNNSLVNLFNKPVFNANYKFDCFINIATNEPISDFDINNIMLVSGIARPEYLITQLKHLNFNIKAAQIFPDHKKYSIDDIKLINKKISELNINAIVTTQKDAVKLFPHISSFNVPIYAIKMKLDVNIKEILDIFPLKNSLDKL